MRSLAPADTHLKRNTAKPIQDPPPATSRSGGLLPAGGMASVMLLVGISAALIPALTAGDEIDSLLGWCFSVIEQ